MTYLVIQRNFDIVPSPLNSPAAQTQYSSYVNDVLYTYNIFENCAGTPTAGTTPIPTDPYAQTYAPVASMPTTFLDNGYFYTGLTRDDVAGLRYLLTTNNINTEDPATGALLLTTTNGLSTVITTSNLNDLVVASLTNDPTLIPGLFPGVTVTSYSNYWVAVGTPNVVTYYSTPYGSPYPGASNLVSVTTGYTTTAQEMFVDTFGGIITSNTLNSTPNIFLNGLNVVLDYEQNTPATLVTTSQGPLGYGTVYPAPIVTNTTTQAIWQPTTSGEYFSIPAGQCGWRFLSPQPAGFPFANVISSTNVISTTTNITTAATNITTVSIVNYFTNHTYVVVPITCETSTPAAGLYEGVESIRFVRADYDSLIGQAFQPITNSYTMTLVTNSQTAVQNMQRLITTPDVLLTAADTATAGYALQRTAPVWDEANILAGLAGPGTINPPVTLTFDKVGPLYENDWLALDLNPLITTIGETNQTLLFAWASFDNTTNDPVAYPSGTSIQNLMNEVLIQITPATVPDGANNTVYAPVTFAINAGSGGAFEPPFSWSAAGLPAGLTLSSAGVCPANRRRPARLTLPFN